MKTLFRIMLFALLSCICFAFSACATQTMAAPGGAAWHSGTGIPNPSDGTSGDYYLDFDTGSVYEKTADGWTIRGTLHSSETPSSDPERVSVTFDANGGELPGGYLRETILSKGDSMALPVPTRPGYRFLGWFYGEGANSGQANDLTVFARDILLTAKWQKLHVLTLASEQTVVLAGEGFIFHGEYDGTEAAAFSLFLEHGGIRLPIEEAGEFISQPMFEFAPENGTLHGVLAFLKAGEYRLVLVAEEDGERVEATLPVSVRAAQ